MSGLLRAASADRRPSPKPLRTGVCLALAASLGACAVTGCEVSHPGSTEAGDAIVDSLSEAAHPVRTTGSGDSVKDLAPLGRIVGDAYIVNVGETAHSSHELTVMQQRMFRFLSEEKGFNTFAREMSWSTGLLLNEYIQTGRGDPRAIMDRELEMFYQVFDTREFLELIESMRAHNQTHDENVTIIGTDLGYPGRILFREVDRYVERRHRALRPIFERLYRGLIPEPGMHLGAYMRVHQTKPLAERQAAASRAWTAVRLLSEQDPGARDSDRAAFDWALQQATAIAQSAEGYSFDTTTPEGQAQAGEYRDRVMADNIEWWHVHRGRKIMVSNFVGHASYEPFEHVRAPAAALLKRRFGREHVNVGLTFAHGGSTALLETNGSYRPYQVAADDPEHNEFTLDRVDYDSFVLDLRAGVPAAVRNWLSSPRKTFAIGGSIDPDQHGAAEFDMSLGHSFDVVVHLDEIRHATPLF